MNHYKGYTYYIPSFLLPIWKAIFCKRGWHLWDEVESSSGEPYNHYLCCDACNEELFIKDKENERLETVKLNESL